MTTKKLGRGVDNKGRSKKGGKFVRLGDGMLTSEAWKSLSGSAIKYYIELRRRYNGTNNGDLHLSLEEARKCLRMARDTVLRVQQEAGRQGLHPYDQARWLPSTRRHYLGTHGRAGARHATDSRLQELEAEKESFGPETGPYSVQKSYRQRRLNRVIGPETRPIEAHLKHSFGLETGLLLDIYQGGMKMNDQPITIIESTKSADIRIRFTDWHGRTFD